MDEKTFSTAKFIQIVFSHYGLDIDKLKKEGREFDFLIYETEKAGLETGNMAGFGLDRSQRIIIDYDKNYDKFLVRREIGVSGMTEGIPYTVKSD